MHRYVIERDLPGAGRLTDEQLRGIAQTSNGVLRDMGYGIQWEHSYVTAERIYCVYLAENEQMVRDHAKLGGFPCSRINEAANVIGPLTANPQSD